jgi:hypothetical protein
MPYQKCNNNFVKKAVFGAILHIQKALAAKGAIFFDFVLCH